MQAERITGREVIRTSGDLQGRRSTTGSISRDLTSSAGVLPMILRIIELPLIAGTMN
jgi:hypothetical protein